MARRPCFGCFFSSHLRNYTNSSRSNSITLTQTSETVYLLKPARIFDGESAQPHVDWVVLVRGEKIEAVGPAREVKAPSDAKIVDLPGMTLMPGLIDAHSHILLHPYSESYLERSGRERSS
jgi:imidazolonepropionase-like amidohydrolase